MTGLLDNLAGLPLPTIIEPLDYQTILAAKIADLSARFPDIAPYLSLETEPSRISLEENAYRELLLRGRVNDAFQQTLLVFAKDSGLDALAGFYDVTRLSGETDDALRLRVSLEIAGRSTGGTAPRYRAKALGASINVRDAIVWRDALTPRIHVAVISTDVGGVASPTLLSTVSDALNDASVKMVNDTLSVVSAVSATQDVTADVWLLPDAPSSIFDSLPATLAAAWTAEAGLGFNLTQAWLTARLMVPGVQRVAILTPTADVVMAPYQALALGTITLNNRGRDY